MRASRFRHVQLWVGTDKPLNGWRLGGSATCRPWRLTHTPTDERLSKWTPARLVHLLEAAPGGWPRGMTAPLAAAYVGLSETAVRAGAVGPPIHLSPGRVVRLREALDAFLDRKAGIVPAGDGSEWLAAFKEQAAPAGKSRYPWRNK